MAKMTKKKWIEQITEDCKSLGTYKDAFLPAIRSLAALLTQHDKTWAEFEASGGKVVGIHVNKAGAENLAASPAYAMWLKEEEQIMKQRTALGLNAAGLKKLDASALKKKRGSALASALNDLG